MGRLSMQSGGKFLCLLGLGWGNVGFFNFSFFLMCSHRFPNMFPKLTISFLRHLALHFSSDIVLPLLNFHLYICRLSRAQGHVRGQRRGKHEKACFYFGEGSTFRFLCQWGVPHVSNILVMGNSNGLFKGKKLWGMNRSNNKYPKTYSYSTNLPLS